MKTILVILPLFLSFNFAFALDLINDTASEGNKGALFATETVRANATETVPTSGNPEDELENNFLPYIGINYKKFLMESDESDAYDWRYNLERSGPSIIESVSISNQGQVKVSIGENPEDRGTEAIRTYLMYRVAKEGSNSPWQELDLDNTDRNGKKWEGELEDYNGEPIEYYLQTVNTADNSTTELPCMLTSKNDSDPCWIPIAGNQGALDDVETNLISRRYVDDNFTIDNVKVGYNSEHLYVRIKVNGVIERGTVTPMELATYFVVFRSPGEEYYDTIDRGNVAIFSPASIVIPGTRPCFLGYNQVGNQFYAEEYRKNKITCDDQVSQLTFRVSLDSLEAHKMKFIDLSVGMGAITKAHTDSYGIFYNATPVNRIVFK